MNKGTSKREKKQESRELENQCWVYLKPFLEELHQRVDRQLVDNPGKKASQKRLEEGKILRKVAKLWGAECFTFGIAALQAVLGQSWHSPIIFVLSCVGTKVIISLAFLLLPQNRKVEPFGLGSTLSLALGNFSFRAPLPPSFPP